MHAMVVFSKQQDTIRCAWPPELVCLVIQCCNKPIRLASVPVVDAKGKHDLASRVRLCNMYVLQWCCSGGKKMRMALKLMLEVPTTCQTTPAH